MSRPENRNPGRSVRGEAGFALVAMLVLLVAMAALATGGFFVANADYQISQNHMAGSNAFHVSDAALEDHFGTNRRGTNTVSYTYAGGTAAVSGRTLIDIGDGNFLHEIVSNSLHTPPEGGQAVRRSSMVAMTSNGGFTANAALTAGGGIQKNGGSGQIDGNDQASGGDCTPGPQPAVAGVATGPGMYNQNGGSPVPTGTPPIDTSQSAYDQVAALGIDWAGLLAGTAVAPDFTIPGDSWPNFGSIDPDWWPVILVDQASYTANPGDSGRGTLIVRGDLTLSGSFQWDGIILVGGAIISNGDNNVEGTAVAGLNTLLGQSVPPTAIANGNKKFLFQSCWVRFAAQQFLGGLVPVPGTWSEGM